MGGYSSWSAQTDFSVGAGAGCSRRTVPAKMAAPCATMVIGSTLSSALTPSASSTAERTSGVSVGPPTKISFSSAPGPSPWRVSSARQISTVRCTEGRMSSSYSPRVTSRSTSTVAPFSSWHSSGIERPESSLRDRSILASSQAALSRATARKNFGLARAKSGSGCCLCSRSMTWATSFQSKSLPPRKLSPSWSTTLMRPSRARISDVSKVPPPRS